jgi:hypothetical protein
MINETRSHQVLLVSLFLLINAMGILSVYATTAVNQSNQSTSTNGSTQAPADFKGTWSGTFFSKYSNVAPFTMTVVITPNSKGHLVGSSTLNSECVKGTKFEVTVTGSQLVLAGSDEEGNSLTVRGTLDSTGTLLQANYILNGSAGGRCETDDGTGTLSRR